MDHTFSDISWRTSVGVKYTYRVLIPVRIPVSTPSVKLFYSGHIGRMGDVRNLYKILLGKYRKVVIWGGGGTEDDM